MKGSRRLYRSPARCQALQKKHSRSRRRPRTRVISGAVTDGTFAVSKRAGIARAATPVAFFIISEMTLWTIAHATGAYPFAASTWGRWDTGHYLSIAAHGYEMHPCEGGPHSFSEGICGNAVWMPLYPMLMRCIGALGVSLAGAGWFISVACRLAGLLLLWNRFPDETRWTTAALCLATAALFPGGVYYDAIFPVSAFLLCELGALEALVQRRAFCVAVLTTLASMLYTTGIIFAGVAVAWGLLEFAVHRERPAYRAIISAAAGSVLGFLAVLAWQQVTIHDWRAFFEMGSHYGHGVRNPLSNLWQELRPIFYLRGRTPANLAIALCCAWTTLTLVAIAVAMPLRSVSSSDRLVLVFGVVYWLFPVGYGNPATISIQRAASLLLPIVILLRYLPRPLIAAIFSSGAFVALLLADAFFRYTII